MTKAQAQVTEIIGRNRLVNELLSDGLEVALPLRDCGIDLIAYAAFERHPFIAIPIQMKVSTHTGFSVDKKYEGIPNLMIVYIWGLAPPTEPATYALTYSELLPIANESYVQRRGRWSTSKPSKTMLMKLAKYRTVPGYWQAKIQKMVNDRLADNGL